MKTVGDLFADINVFFNMQNSTNPIFIDKTYSTTKIQNWINAMEKYRLGIYEDAPITLSNEDNPKIALQNLNLFTNQGKNGVPVTCSYDNWVYDVTNCTNNSTESVYVASTYAQSSYFPPSVGGSTLCISLNSKADSSFSYIWTLDDIANRYKVYRLCGGDTAFYDGIITYATSIINYRDSRINLYQKMKD